MRFIWIDGVRTEWNDALVHVWDEVAIRGVSAFEGILCVWRADLDRHVVVAYEKYMRRMQRSASLIDLPLPFDTMAMDRVLREAMGLFPDRTFYVRPTAYVLKGRSSRHPEHLASWFVGAFQSAWRRTRRYLTLGSCGPRAPEQLCPPTPRRAAAI